MTVWSFLERAGARKRSLGAGGASSSSTAVLPCSTGTRSPCLRRPLVRRVDITATTQAAAGQGHQERQVIAGRYRLGSFHRGDDSTEVWRALDESTKQVVSLEFLRDPNPASRERFVAGA